jgi:hypothetical protein
LSLATGHGSSGCSNGKGAKAKSKSKARTLDLQKAATPEVAASLIRTKTLTNFNQAVANLGKSKNLLDDMLQKALLKYGSHEAAMVDRRFKISHMRSGMIEILMSHVGSDTEKPGATTEKIMQLMTDDEYFVHLFEINSGGGNKDFVVQTVGLMREIRAALGDLESVGEVASCAADHSKAIEVLAEVARAGRLAAEQWTSNVLARDKALEEERKMQEKERLRLEKESQTAVKKQKMAEERALAKRAKMDAKEACRNADPDEAAEEKRRRISQRVTSQISDDDPAILSLKKAQHIAVVENAADLYAAVQSGLSAIFRARKAAVQKVLEFNDAPG